MRLDHALWYGNKSQGSSLATQEKTSQQSSKRLSESQNQKPPIFMCLRTGGLIPVASWADGGALRGEFLMHSFGESPSVAVESRLSQILVTDAPQRYYLSAAAAKGILNRAKRRGKELPEMLRIALEQQAMSQETQTKETEDDV